MTTGIEAWKSLLKKQFPQDIQEEIYIYLGVNILFVKGLFLRAKLFHKIR